MIGLECEGVKVHLLKWNRAVSDAAFANAHFASPESMFYWLDGVFPEWRDHLADYGDGLQIRAAHKRRQQERAK